MNEAGLLDANVLTTPTIVKSEDETNNAAASVDDLLSDAVPEDETKGKSKIFGKEGGIDSANV